jgi:hypothetical protein
LFKDPASDFPRLQFNATLTVFLGGVTGYSSRRIMALDWTTQRYTEHDSRLHQGRSHSACTTMKSEEGAQ